MSEPRPDTEREWLEGLRYEDKFPEPRPDTVEIAAIKRRWSTAHERGAHDYTDEGCRILAEHAFVDIPALVEWIAEAEAALESILRNTHDTTALGFIEHVALSALRSLRGETT